MTLNWRTTVYWRRVQAILMVKEAKGKTKDSFGSQLARNFLPLRVSVSKTHARPLSVERENFNGSHSTWNKRKTIMYREPQFMYNCNDPNLEWSVLLTRPWRSLKHACIPGDRWSSTMYWRSHLIHQRAISNHYKRSRRILGSLRHTDPRFGSNLRVYYLLFWKNYAAPTSC